MIDADFPEKLCRFIEETITTIEAVELLLCLARHPERSWTAEELVHEIRPSEVPETLAKKHLATFAARGLLAQTPGDGFHYKPASDDLEATVQALAKAYNERPVTLIRLIYTFKDKKIQSFADAFKIKKD